MSYELVEEIRTFAEERGDEEREFFLEIADESEKLVDELVELGLSEEVAQMQVRVQLLKEMATVMAEGEEDES